VAFTRDQAALVKREIVYRLANRVSLLLGDWHRIKKRIDIRTLAGTDNFILGGQADDPDALLQMVKLLVHSHVLEYFQRICKAGEVGRVKVVVYFLNHEVQGVC